MTVGDASRSSQYRDSRDRRHTSSWFVDEGLPGCLFVSWRARHHIVPVDVVLFRMVCRLRDVDDGRSGSEYGAGLSSPSTPTTTSPPCGIGNDSNG